MNQSDFTKDNAKNAIECAEEIFKALPKTKQMDFLGYLNDLMLFLESAQREAK